jgi:hypothetical protein
MSKKETSEMRSNPPKRVSTKKIISLFRDAEEQEHNTINSRTKRRTESYAQSMRGLANFLLLGVPLFREFELPRDDDLVPYPLRLSYGQPKHDLRSTGEWRYEMILHLLRRETDRGLRLLLLARWLKQECVCEPEDLLPLDEAANLTRKIMQQIGLRPTDMAYWMLIKKWKRYFALLLSELKTTKDESGGSLALIKRGYDQDAIALASRKKSEVAASIAWLSQRTQISQHALENAWSRMSGAKARSLPNH